MVSFDISHEDSRLVGKIVDRLSRMARTDGRALDKLSTRMDLVATHANGCPMDFVRLSEADDFNLCHDVYGIARHIDRATGQLTGCFMPRFAAKQSANAA